MRKITFIIICKNAKEKKKLSSVINLFRDKECEDKNIYRLNKAHLLGFENRIQEGAVNTDIISACKL